MVTNVIALQNAIDGIKTGAWNEKSFEETVSNFFEIITMSVIDVEKGKEQPTLNFLKPIQENPTSVGIDKLRMDKFKLTQKIIDILVNEALRQNAEDIVVEDLKQIQQLMK